ncbi:trypsin-like serine peptidase [Pseudooceanicola aestuarii]|uniref:trypsin-like serine peptidase n=1 Tax=Pseudooceanicola aestuarii TaxID=2697319 RepID=UPI0013D08FF9|nr:trypsin-like serine protease [Pseudooceanicola aestuarii]
MLSLLHRVALAVLFALPGGGTVLAQSGLKRLDTGIDSRGWEAVGRLDLDGRGFCTGALIEPALVLTAAHCMFDRSTGERFTPDQIEFQAGVRNGRADAYRNVRRAVLHPDYEFGTDVSPERVRHDIALLELYHPIRQPNIAPFRMAPTPRSGDPVGVVSYAHDRADAPSLETTCGVIAAQQGVLVTSCDVDYGSSGAPIFSFFGGVPMIVSVVSAKAEVEGQRVALGSELDRQIKVMKGQLDSGLTPRNQLTPGVRRIQVGGGRNSTGAKFITPDN